MFGMMEALLSFFRRQVGLRTDPADAAGSLHGKVAQLRSDFKAGSLPASIVASDHLRYSDDAESTYENITDDGVITKSVRLYSYGSVKISFDAKKNNSEIATAYAVSINAVARNNIALNNTVYNTFTHVFDGVLMGSDIELLIRSGSTTQKADVSIKNFRLYFDTAPATGTAKIS